MRPLLIRSIMTAVAVALATVAVPALTVLVVFALRPPGQRYVLNRLTGTELALAICTGWVVLAAIAMALAVIVARRRAAVLTAPLTELAGMAERLGDGSGSLVPLATGIGEVDRISEVLAASSNDLSRTLVAERDFAANASHQLRTPLAALLLRLDEIAATDDPAVAREEAQIAMDQVERLSGVVDDLLGKPRSGTPDAREVVSLDSVIAALQREWQPAFAQARRSMRVHGQRGLNVRIRRAALSQILSTLIENSLTHGRGTLSVEARRSGPSVVVEVSDQGVGVPADLAPRIFERSVSSGGSGLGLALARDLAEQNYGRLELVCAEPAVFSLFLSEAEGSSSLAKTNRR